MIKLKSVIHDTATNSVEATWVDRSIAPDTLDEDGNTIPGEVTDVQIKCHSYADVQMGMLRADIAEFGGDIAEYETLIALVESNIQPPVPQTQAEIAAVQFRKLEAALDNHLDTAARDKRYNDRFTFALRAGYPSPFQAEAIVFATWMDLCNAQSYAAMLEVIAGTRPMPTVAELIAALPALVYPT